MGGRWLAVNSLVSGHFPSKAVELEGEPLLDRVVKALEKVADMSQLLHANPFLGICNLPTTLSGEHKNCLWGMQNKRVIDSPPYRHNSKRSRLPFTGSKLSLLPRNS